MESWASASGGSNDVYMGNRLDYRQNATDQDKLIQFGSAGAALQSIAIWGTVLSAIFAAILAAVVGVGNSSQCSYNTNGQLSCGSGNQGILIFALAGYVIVAAWPRRHYISRWELMLDGKADAAESCYTMIANALKSRKIPAEVKPRRVQSADWSTVRNYLSVKRGKYNVYVGVFPFGTNLYMTWSMWRETSSAGIIWAAITGGTEFDRVIRSDPDRALREAVHNATREGVESAITGAAVAVDQFLRNIPIEVMDQPAPGGSPVAQGSGTQKTGEGGPRGTLRPGSFWDSDEGTSAPSPVMPAATATAAPPNQVPCRVCGKLIHKASTRCPECGELWPVEAGQRAGE